MNRGPDRIQWKPATPAELQKLKMVQDRAVEAHACHCIGAQNGQPACPCQMRGVTIENGRYVRRVDLGPAP